MPIVVRPVPVDSTKLVSLVLDVDLVAAREQEKHLLVLRHPIVYVHKTYVHVPMVLLLPEPLVPHTIPTFARLVLVDTTKMETVALDVELLAVPVQDKQLLVYRHPIVDAHKTPVRVPTVLLQLQLLVRQTMPTFARPVPADTTKMVTPALDVDLLAVPEQEKQLRVLQRLIVFVHKMCVHVPTV